LSITNYPKGGSVARLLAQPGTPFDVAPDIIEALPVAIYACNTQGRILWFNYRAAELWGRQPALNDAAERFCGSYKLYFNGRLTPLDRCPMAYVLRTGNPVHSAEGLVVRPDGTSVWATVHIEPVEDETGVLIGAINCFHDSTAMHRTHAELEDFFENSTLPMHIVARDGTIVRANKAELAMLGCSAEEYIGKSIIDFHADRPVIDDILRRLLRGESIQDYPARLRARDGSIRYVLVTSSARTEDGEFVNTRCVTVDVTEQKRAEDTLAQRMAEQTALYDLTERLHRARTMQDIYDAALDATAQALQCRRASILLFDDTNAMRFVAWRGLSEAYRRAVEGHSPWQPGEANPKPLCVNDVQTSGLEEALKATVLAEKIGAAAFVPLMDRDRLLGKFMIYHKTPHVFTDAEINLTLTIARQVGFAIERLRTALYAEGLAAIVEFSDDAIISAGLDTIITTWNRGAERLYGYTREEAVGQSLLVLIPPDRPDEESVIIDRILAGEKIDHFETVRQAKGGRRIDVSLTVSPVRDVAGRIVGISKSARDISERKKAEHRLRESEQRLQDLLAAIPAAIYTTDAKGRITYYNQAAVELAGRTPVIGTDEWCVTWKLYWPDGTPLPHDQCPMAVALQEGRAIRGAEAVAERPDGTRVPFIPYPTPIRDAAGNIVGAINMLVDISERRQAETHQRMLLNELNHRVKNNMQTIQSLLDAAARRVRGDEARDVFDQATRRIAAMAAAQRILYGTANATRFAAQDFVPAVCKTAQETFRENVSIVCEPCSGELPNDAAMPLALILNELLTNASKHGGGADHQTVIRAGLINDGDSFLLYVEDEGPGFDLASVIKRSSGLRLVQGLAGQLRGKLYVTTNPTRCSVRFNSPERARAQH
jgi:PAS domain S-box-containing protein